MNRRILDAIRTGAIELQRVPSIEWLGQRAYDLGFRATTARLYTVPGVASVLLRRSRASRAWSLGLSDYDLTVLIDDRSARERLELLGRFWKTYRRLKRIVPILGETEILSLGDFDDYLSFGPAATKRHELIFARSDVRASIDGTVRKDLERPRVRRDVLRVALLRYLQFALPRMIEWSIAPSRLRQAIALRAVEHVRERLALGSESPSPDPTAFGSPHPRRAFGDAFRALSSACRRDSTDDEEAVAISSLGPRRRKTAEWSSWMKAIPPTGLAGLVEWACFASGRSQIAAIVDDEIDDQTLETHLTAFSEAIVGMQAKIPREPVKDLFTMLRHPVLVTRSMWRRLRDLLPFEAAAIRQTGLVLAGEHDLVDGSVWHTRSLYESAGKNYAALLALKNNGRAADPEHRRTHCQLSRWCARSYLRALEGEEIETAIVLDGSEQDSSVESGHQALDRELRALRHKIASGP